MDKAKNPEGFPSVSHEQMPPSAPRADAMRGLEVPPPFPCISPAGRVLSSPTTLWWRFGFPMLWIVVFGSATLALWLGAAKGRNNEPPPEFVLWLFPIMWLVGSLSSVSFARRLSHVVLLDNAVLEVSSFGRADERIPLSSVVSVGQSLLSRVPTVILHLGTTSSQRRREIVFVPDGKKPIFAEHPICGELRALVARTF